MFPSIPPASNDMSQAYTLLAAASDPKSTKDRLDQINQSMSTLKIAQDDLNERLRQFGLDQVSADMHEEGLKARQEDLNSQSLNLRALEKTLKDREDKVSARENNVAIVEKSQSDREDRTSSKERQAVSKLDELKRLEDELRNKHGMVDLTQEALDKRLAKIQSVLQS